MTQNLTRGGLQAAKIVNLKTNEEVLCMFNPFEYTIAKQNSYQRGNQTGQDAPNVTFQQGGPRTLQLTLYFDTLAAGTSVMTHTDKLAKMMNIEPSTVNAQSNKGTPPEVKFVWGALTFKAVITSMTQRFTLFTPDGKPVRANVQVSFQELLPEQSVQAQDDTAQPAGTQGQTTTVTQGDRPDNVAAANGGDPNNMRNTMDANNVDDPLRMRNGTQMRPG